MSYLFPTYEEKARKHTKTLRKLRSKRQREESLAKMRRLQAKEHKRISKARSAGRKKGGVVSGVSSLLEGADKIGAWAEKAEKRQKKYSGY